MWYIPCDGRPEHLDAKGIGDNFLGFLVEVRVDEGHVVVANDAVAQCRQFLFDSFDLARRGDGTFTASGSEFLMALSSVSEQVLGTSSPFLLPRES
jgi:hypothetical protein